MAWNNRKKRMGRTIIVEDNNVNRAISALKHVMAPVLKELKQRKYYEKPSEKRRRKQKEAARKLRKKLRLMEDQW
jgi:small subunit ribosomal protein S21